MLSTVKMIILLCFALTDRMTNKSLGNQTSGGFQAGERDEPELKDTTPQQCGWVSHNMLLALTVLGVFLYVYLYVYIFRYGKIGAVKFSKVLFGDPYSGGIL